MNVMKKLFTSLVIISLTISFYAQTPQKMSYQAVIRNSSGQLVVNHAVGTRVSILKGSETGTAVYVETQIPTTDGNGLATIEIGKGTPVSGTFPGIDWSTGLYFVKSETDPAGGIDYSIAGTSQLLSVPYALYAKTAGNVSNHYAGELFGGGIVVAVWKINGIEHGLVASLTDLSPGVRWTNVNGYIGQAAQSPIDGLANSNAIISQSELSAAKLCIDYTNPNTGTGVYSDWYLPAFLELNQCFDAVLIVNAVLGSTDGFQFVKYWSSTEDPNHAVAEKLAWSLNFSDGSKTIEGKGILNRVRAVRRF